MNITLPYPPTVNTYWRSIVIGGRVRVLISKRGRQYREQVIKYILSKYPKNRTKLTERLSVKILLSPPDRRVRDIDNAVKGLLDALTHAGIWVDDSQIDDLHVIRTLPQPGGSVCISIDPL